ncbi:MAG: signal peptide peptidase SppA [Chloroflexota bacterium]|nr:signal peptide peptidase SppA [Chloroflexota bacterium]
MKKATTIGLAVLLLLATLIPAGCVSIGSVGKIAVISLTGVVGSGSSSLIFGSTISPALVREQLGKAEYDVAVKAVVLRVESPGGAVAPCQEILEEIEKIKQIKPVVVSMGDMAASGGYYISAEADKIVALPGTLTGSIGVISQIPNIKGLYDKLGIEMQIFKSGKYKDMYSGLRELSSEEKEIMQRMTDEYYEQFIEVVAEGRGLSKEEVRNLATGQLYTGVEAKKLGLIDELGGLDVAIASAAQLADIETWQVEYYKPTPSLLESLLGMNLSSLAEVVQLKLWGLGGEDIVLLQTLSRSYPQPQYLCES